MVAIDITSIIGCPNMCIYCPQDVFLKNYKGEKILTVEKLEIMLNNIDINTTLIFAGYSEGFFNDNITDLLLFCYNKGYKIQLFTTLQGFTDDKLNKLANKISFDYVYFHKYNGKSFNMKKFFFNFFKFIDNIKVKKYVILRVDVPISRASNLKGFDVDYKYGKIKCNHYGNDTLWCCNQLLPNGDVYLCSMDWSLKHKIGNIFDNHYDSVEFNNERSIIQNLMNEYDSDLLCRKCEIIFK